MRKGAVIMVLFLSLAVILSGAPVWAQESVKVGIILPLTGGQAAFGEIERNSFEMAAAKINANGGINGKKLELLFEDDTGKPDVARAAAEKLIDKDKVVMLGGGYGSSETFAVAGVAQQNQIPFLVNTGSADKITEQGWTYVFRLNPPVSAYPAGLESFLKEVAKPKTAAILYEDSAFGTSGSKHFKETCKNLGIKVVLDEGYSKGGVDFKPLLVKVKEAKPDLVYMISYVMDAALLMTQSMELRVMPSLFVGGGAGFTLPEFQKNAGNAANMVFSATLWYQTLPYPGAQQYFDDYVSKYGKATEYHGAEAYAAAQVIADALGRAKSMSREDVREALAATDTTTVFGPVKFVSYDKKINQNRLATYLVQWLDGKLELVWPKDLASKPYVYPIDWTKAWQ